MASLQFAGGRLFLLGLINKVADLLTKNKEILVIVLFNGNIRLENIEDH
jgi:hypothetical protein